MSHASWSCATSQSSLISRSSEATRVSSGSTSRTRVLRSSSKDGRSSMWRTSRPSESEISLQRRAAAGPELAVLPVAEELVGLAGGAGPGVEHGLAVVDDQHCVAGLVAGEVGVRGVGTEPVVGVVGAHLVGAGRQHQPLAGEGLRERRSTLGGRTGDRLDRQVEVAVAPALAHEGGVGGGDSRVVRLGLGLCGLGVVLAHPAHSTPGLGSRREPPIGCGPCPEPAVTAPRRRSPSRSW